MDNLTREEILSIHTKTKSEFSEKIDDLQQQLYDCKRQLSVTEALQAEYQQEIDALSKSQKCLECEKLASKLKEKDDILTEQIEHSEKLEENLRSCKTNVLKLTEQLHELNTNKSNVSNTSANFEAEIQRLLVVNEDIMKQNEDYVNCNEKIALELQIICGDYESLRKAHEEVKHESQCTEEELTRIRDELAVLQGEINSKKENINSVAEPGETRGNSLFAEVNDNRVILQQKMRIMCKQYEEQRREHGNILKQLSALQSENERLNNLWNNEMKKIRDEEEQHIHSYKIHIETLKNTVSVYKEELAKKNETFYKVSEKNSYESLRKMIQYKDEQIARHINEINSEAQEKLMVSVNLNESQVEARAWKYRANELENQLKCFKVKRDLEMRNVHTQTIETNDCGSMETSNNLTIAKPVIKKPSPIYSESSPSRAADLKLRTGKSLTELIMQHRVKTKKRSVTQVPIGAPLRDSNIMEPASSIPNEDLIATNVLLPPCSDVKSKQDAKKTVSFMNDVVDNENQSKRPRPVGRKLICNRVFNFE